MKKRYFTTFELILLALFSALIVAAKIVLHFPIKAPGHSGVFWMALVIVALGIVPKLGAGSIIGLISGTLAAFMGLGDNGAIYTFFSYTILGIVSDLVQWFIGGVESPVRATLVGAAGNIAKMLMKTLLASLMRIPAGFIAFGLLISFGSNLLWGSIGGLLGWMILAALRKAGFFAYMSEKR